MLSWLRRLLRRPMSAGEIQARIEADHRDYLRRHGLTGPSPNNMGTPENPYGSLALSKEYQDLVTKSTRKGLDISDPPS